MAEVGDAAHEPCGEKPCGSLEAPAEGVEGVPEAPAETGEVQEQVLKLSEVDDGAAGAASASPVADASTSVTPTPLCDIPTTPTASMLGTPTAGMEGISEQAEVEDFSSEPLAQRLESKDLARRCSAYIELQATMESGSDATGEAFELLGKHVDTCLGETLPKGQDAALTALAVYLEHCPGIEQRSAEMLALVRKLAEHKAIDKPKMQQLAPNVVLLVAEMCECPPVVKELMDCLADLETAKKKSQGFFKKQVAFIVKLFCQLLCDFGIQKMPPKLGYLSAVLKYVTDSDRGIREACYGVLVELAAWMGDISEYMKSMDEPQKKEVTKRMEAAKEDEQAAKEVKRRYRGETAPAPDDKSAKLPGICDMYDMEKEVDPFKKLPKGWCISKVVSMEKWKDKLQHLQVLTNLLDTPRLAPGDGYSSVVPYLQRMLKSESNIPVMTEVAKCMGLMSRGLRKDFEKSARLLLPVALARISDKSVWKSNCLIERVEQLLWSLPYDALLEELRQHIASKSLFVKKEALNLLLRALDLPQVQLVCPDAFQRFFSSVAAAALPLIDDSDNTVRQEAAKLLAALVFHNRDAPDVASVVLDKLPAHRRVVFDDEWRKLTKDVPCPTSSSSVAAPVVEAAVERPASPRNAGRRISPLRQRHASPASVRPEDASEGPAVPASTASNSGRRVSPLRGARQVEVPSTAAAPAPACVPQEATLEAAAAEYPAAESAATLETPLMKQMAEEIKNLRSKVERMEAERSQPPAAAAPVAFAQAPAPSAATGYASQPAGSRLRVPSGSRASAETSVDRGARPVTPHRTRERSSDGRAATPTRREATPLRREPTPTRRDPTPPKRDGTPTRQRQPAASAARGSSLSKDHTCSLSRDTSLVALQANGGAAPFRIFLPKHSKQARQQKERSQYWGPEQIPSEFLATLKEVWRHSVEDGLWRLMFSERLEDQLLALQSWKRQVCDSFTTILEADVLDLVLKWLTWMLFNTNTQVWKLVLDVLGALLQNLAGEGQQLTERESQILVPNIVERSGHNILAIREMMSSILRLCIAVCPRLRILPMLLHGLGSKSKRSAACSMRAIGDALDRSTALALLRSQKDLALVLKMTEDKDADVKKSSVHTVALFSLHLDDDAFVRACRGLPAAAKAPVRAAALKLMQGGGEAAQSLNQSFESGSALRDSTPVVRRQSGENEKVPAPRANSVGERRRSGEATALAPRSPMRPQTQRTPSASPASRTRACSPQASPAPRSRQPSPHPSPSASSRGYSPARGFVQGAAARPSTSPLSDVSTRGSLRDASTREIAARLSRFTAGGGQHEDFVGLCAILTERAKTASEGDAPCLTDAVVGVMPACFDALNNRTERCGPLLEVLDEICATKSCVRSLPVDSVRKLLRELLRNLEHTAWSKRLEDGPQQLRKLNLSCVMLLNGISFYIAYPLLLDLGLEESEVVSGSLIVKCLRKLCKNLASSRSPEHDAQAVLGIVQRWLEKASRREDKGGAAFAAVAPGAKEVVQAAMQASPAAVAKWAEQLEQVGGEASILRTWLPSDVEKEKENSLGGSHGRAPPKEGQLKPSSPCKTLNSVR